MEPSSNGQPTAAEPAAAAVATAADRYETHQHHLQHHLQGEDEENVLFLSLQEMRAAGYDAVSCHSEDIPPPKADFSAPPPYDASPKLPTYEEVQREKTLEAENIPDIRQPHCAGQTPPPLTVLAIDAEANDDANAGLLGTDFVFFTAFLVAFVFNWVGFLLLMCFCNTIASRYGALAGFGLSLAKWTFIVKNATEFANRENNWLWWLIMLLGIVICIRAIMQYVNIKRGWQLLSSSHQERLLLFF